MRLEKIGGEKPKKDNPDLPKETFPLSTPGESSQDDEKPQLPAILPSDI